MQATLAALGLLSSIAAWLAGATFWWRVGGVVPGAVIPFTLIVILPTNKELLGPTLDRRSAQTERLLARWGALHAVRSVLSALALLLFLYLAIFKKPLLRNYSASVFTSPVCLPSPLSLHSHGRVSPLAALSHPNGTSAASLPRPPTLRRTY
jgi:hypothetical protein